MLLLYFLLVITLVQGLPQGAPPKACDTMFPEHRGTPSQRSGAPYGVFPRRTSNGVSVTITSTLGLQFQGFMLQARAPNGELVGTFEPLGSAAKTLDCYRPADSITHSSPINKTLIEAIWTQPPGYEGPVIFNTTIAQDYSTFWVGVETPPVDIRRRAITEPAFNFDHRFPTTPPPVFIPVPPHEASTEFDPFYDGCGRTKLCFGSPGKCLDSRNCKAVAAISVMVDRYIIEMKAHDNAEWVGVGLSDDNRMGDDSVVECAKRGRSVDAFMGWTTGSPNYGYARLRNSKLGIRLLNASMIDDALYCKVVRDTRTSVNGRVYDLQNKRYNLLVAAGKTAQNYHDITFAASENQQLLADVSPLKAASKLLIRLHGSFMLAAWIGTASIGIVLARYYRQTWVGRSMCGKDLWFAWHRIFMVLTWTLTMVAFILIFVELKSWSQATIHAVLGTITTIICFVQPIGAFFRPHPGTSRRPLFNWGHWLAGNSAHILAIITIFFAVKLTKADLPEFMDWILVAFVVFHVIMHIILSVINCISERNSDSRINSLPMKDLGGSGRSSVFNDTTGDAPLTGWRKFLLALYIIVILAFVIALIVITALAPIENAWQDFRSSVMHSEH